MARLGFGFGTRRRGGRPGAAPFPPPSSASAPRIAPSAAWTGEAGSGFASPPADPARIAAKPAMRLIVPPNQAYTDDLLVGVYAGANDGGSLLDTMGLEKVVVHFEGASVDIAEPSFQTFPDANGAPVTYFGWWARLEHDGRNGLADLWFEAVPRDTAMQNRVMGPYQFLPAGSLYDHDLTVAPSQPQIVGSRYQTLTAALNYLRAQSAQHPRVTFKEAYTGTIDALIVPYYTSKGWCRIDADEPVTFRLTDTTMGNIRPRYEGLRFTGGNITFDMRHASEIRVDVQGLTYWYDGVNFIHTGGRNDLWNKGPRPVSGLTRNAPWFTECRMSDVENAGGGAALIRGCAATGGYGDFANGAACVIGCRVDDWDSRGWTNEIPAFTAHYTGGGTTATLELSGAGNANNRVFTAKVEGASVGAFTVQNTEAAFHEGVRYNIANVVEWLNGLPGWTAVLLDDSRLAASCSLPEQQGGSFGPADCKAAPLTVVATFNIRAEWYEKGIGGPHENVVVADNVATRLVAQNILIGGNQARDWLIVNNAFHNKPDAAETETLASQISSANNHSHIVIAHNTHANQGWTFSNASFGPYCLFANNTARTAAWTGTPDANLTFRDNHLQADATNPAHGAGTTIGGIMADLFTNPAAGDFTPQGALLEHMKAPALKYDPMGNARGDPAAAGAR